MCYNCCVNKGNWAGLCTLYFTTVVHIFSHSSPEQEAEAEAVSKGCSCGKNKSRAVKVSCQTSAGGPIYCPCVRKGAHCTRSCRCRNCCNIGKISTKPVACRCGQTSSAKKKGDVTLSSCNDSKKKSKCPCLRNGVGCSSACRCVQCANVHGTNSRALVKSPVRKRKRTQASFKREKGSEFIASSGVSSPSEPWTSHESVLLATVMKFIRLTAITPSTENIARLFNYSVGSRFAKESVQFPLLPKKSSQISGKLAHYKRKSAVDAARISCEWCISHSQG